MTLPKLPTVIAECCREWIVPMSGQWGRCGLCGEPPAYKREDHADDTP